MVGASRVREAATIVRLRAVWTAFVLAMVLVAWMSGFLIDNELDGTVNPAVALAMVVATGLAMFLLLIRQQRRAVTGDGGTALRKAYTQRFFVGLSIAEAPGLLGFTLSLLAQRSSVCYLGVSFSIVGMALVAPTRRRLAREEPRLTAALFEADS
jgi:hypothetical protein